VIGPVARLAAVACLVWAVALVPASADVSYVDPAGDSGGELDVTNVTVGADAATGTITMRIAVTGFAASDFDGRPRNIQVYVDTDLNRNTGGGAGSDLALLVDFRANGLTASIGHPIVGSWPLLPLPPTMSVARTLDGLVWTFNQAEAGIGHSFKFSMYTQMPDSIGGVWQVKDHAPDDPDRVGVMWFCSLDPPPPEPPHAPPVVLTPVFGTVAMAPAAPVAGKRLVFSLPVTRSDNGAPLLNGRLTLDPRIAGKLLGHAESFRKGIARASFVVPKTAKRRILTIHVKVARTGAVASKAFAYRVR
jgi:hypothetical protein